MTQGKLGNHKRESTGHNNPTQSQDITTGTYKTQEAYREQAALHEDPGKQAQDAKPHHKGSHSVHRTSAKADSRLQESLGEKRSGSDSNAHSGRKDSRLHEQHQDWNTPTAQGARDVAGDLHPDFLAGENRGPDAANDAPTAEAIKQLHGRLDMLTNDDLQRLSIMPQGSRLQQGAHYLDLHHLDRGEIVAMGDMVAGPDNDYVPKKETDYELWDRLSDLARQGTPV